MTSGTVVLSTKQTTFNQSLCVTDVATVARPVGQKTVCLETSRLFFYLISHGVYFGIF